MRTLERWLEGRGTVQSPVACAVDCDKCRCLHARPLVFPVDSPFQTQAHPLNHPHQQVDEFVAADEQQPSSASPPAVAPASSGSGGSLPASASGAPLSDASGRRMVLARSYELGPGCVVGAGAPRGWLVGRREGGTDRGVNAAPCGCWHLVPSGQTKEGQTRGINAAPCGCCCHPTQHLPAFPPLPALPQVGTTDFYLSRPHGTRAVCRSSVARVLRFSRAALERLGVEAPQVIGEGGDGTRGRHTGMRQATD